MQVLDTAPSWVEWVGRSVLAPYRASRSTGQLEACVRELVALLNHLRTAVERSIHIHLFAQLLAAGDDVLAAQLRDDLHASLHPLSPPASSSSARAPAPSSSSALTTARSAARAPERSAVRPPLARLAELEVRLDELYVWSAVPDTLHWIATSSCAHERLRARPPSLAELHSLPLCSICAIANEPADATAARLAAAAAAASTTTTPTTTTTTEAATAAAAAAAAAAVGSNVTGSRARTGTRLELDVDCHLMTRLACMCSPQRLVPTVTGLELDVDCHLMTRLACMCSPQRVYPTVTGLELASPRDQAELLLLHVLLQRPGVREYGAAVCRLYGMLDVKSAVKRADEARVLLRTERRRQLLSALLEPPSQLSAPSLFEMLNASVPSDELPCPEWQLLRKPSDGLQYLAKTWAQAASSQAASSQALTPDTALPAASSQAASLQALTPDTALPVSPPSEELPSRLLEVCVQTILTQHRCADGAL